MELLKQRHLVDDISEKFLISKGFQLIPHTKYSHWIKNGCISLHLDIEDVVSTETSLLEAISQNYYRMGREMGKQDALEMIFRNLSSMIFPPNKN